jgi:peroxiredoxin Q/BCP
MIQISDKCPDFQLPDATGKMIQISELIGKKKLVIYFYPKDDTPGCTKEACSFRDSYEDFKNFDCEVIGISSDDEQKHAAFASRHKLPFILLSDKDKVARKLFGVPNSFIFLPGRQTYVVDQNGIIRLIFNSVSSSIHIEKALQVLKNLNESK